MVAKAKPKAKAKPAKSAPWNSSGSDPVADILRAAKMVKERSRPQASRLPQHGDFAGATMQYGIVDGNLCLTMQSNANGKWYQWTIAKFEEIEEVQDGDKT